MKLIKSFDTTAKITIISINVFNDVDERLKTFQKN